MAILWQSSLVPFIDPNGNPRSGMKAYFFDASTTTPRTVYQNSGLGEPHDHPVVADASGVFPAVFLPSGDYRLRLLTSTGVTLSDVDGISTPSTGESGGGGGGDTPVELLMRTGFYTFAHFTGALSGWVRANGRSIGTAASGASERANADCEDLFTLLWGADPTLAVSGGRGASAASDWAASKRISLPDIRSRSLFGLAGMGNTDLTILGADLIDGGETAITLGATGGADRVSLNISQIPAHSHGGTTGQAGTHSHTVLTPVTAPAAPGYASTGSSTTVPGSQNTSTAPNHGHTIASEGGGQAHSSMPPFALATCYVKL